MYTIINYNLHIILDSKRSDEYIDFTMMCAFFFVCMLFVRQQSEYPQCIIDIKSKNLPVVFKKKKNGNFYSKTVYSCNSITNQCKYLNFSPNVNIPITVIYKRLNLKYTSGLLSYLYTSGILDFLLKCR